MYDNIDKIIKESVNASVTLSDGTTAEWGSIEHINDLDETLQRLKILRSQQARSSATRYAFARAVEKLQAQISAAQKYFDRQLENI